LVEYDSLLKKARKKNLVTLLPIISPGLEWDWRVLERKRTTEIKDRMTIIKKFVKEGWNIGVNGEPFIPGVHTTADFAITLDNLKSVGIKSYNTYNLHFNDDVAKKLHDIGLDIEKIWRLNQDNEWKHIQKDLCKIANKKEIILGCPDFVHTGWSWVEKRNTCCGVNVPNPSRFNAHHWKKFIQKGMSPKKAYQKTWEGIGDKEIAKKILKGKKCQFYTMKEIVR
jgi:DNA repair photolyase